MVVLAVTWRANNGKEAEVAEIFRKLESASRQEPGCLMYVVHQHRAQLGRFFIYEQYRDDAALEAHRESQHFRQYALISLRGIAQRVDGELYWPLTSAGSST
jgi:(4S)-4-hydroxy-5-phosphonooxypentane-2,3-dione isomerase